ncbi:hypothetical protein [Streptomyces sp.]
MPSPSGRAGQEQQAGDAEGTGEAAYADGTNRKPGSDVRVSA